MSRITQALVARLAPWTHRAIIKYHSGPFGDWNVVILNRITREAVTCATLRFRPQAERWAADCLARAAWRDQSELPDAYDQAQKERRTAN